MSTEECPYCIARKEPFPPVGTRIIFLKGFDCGQAGTVHPDLHRISLRGEFLVKMDYDQIDALRMASPSLDLYIDEEKLTIPSWMPPLSIEDNSHLHESLMLSIKEFQSASTDKELAMSLRHLVFTAWTRRLPITGAEVYDAFAAHGLYRPEKEKIEIYFDYAIRMIEYTNGRQAIKKKRMPPLSQNRYLTEKQKYTRMQIFGYI